MDCMYKIEGPYAEKHCPTPPFNKRKFKHGHHQGAGILMKEFMVDGDLAPEDWEHLEIPKVSPSFVSGRNDDGAHSGMESSFTIPPRKAKRLFFDS